jgi:hypothetical protein
MGWQRDKSRNIYSRQVKLPEREALRRDLESHKQADNGKIPEDLFQLLSKREIILKRNAIIQ